MSFNTYGKSEKSTGARHQVWAEVPGVKHGGGIIDATAFANYPVGWRIPAGTPVHLDKSGGTLTPVYFYEVLEDVGSSTTKIKLKGFYPLASTGVIMVAPDTIGGQGKGVAYSGGKVEDASKGLQEVTIEGNALGDLTTGTIIAVAGSAHNSESVMVSTTVPNGLLWHDIVKEEGDVWATGAVVDVGRILEDRIVGVPAAYKAVLPGIKFEKGI